VIDLDAHVMLDLQLGLVSRALHVSSVSELPTPQAALDEINSESLPTSGTLRVY
jgi:hypothetical protein